MCACVLLGNLAILINGCLNQEINIQRDLKQDGFVDPFPVYVGGKRPKPTFL